MIKRQGEYLAFFYGDLGMSIPEKEDITKLKAFAITGLLFAAILLPYISGTELKGEEARRVLPAIYMLNNGNWLIPHIGGEPYFQKPPMINWMIAASIKLAGFTSELNVRMPSLISVLALCSVIIITPCSHFNNRLRLLINIFLLSTFSIIEKGRLIEIEAVFLSQIAIAYIWWFFTTIDKRNNWVVYSVPSLAIAMALMTKGPVAFLAFYSVVIVTAISLRKPRLLFNLAHAAFLVISLLPIVLWYIYIKKTGMADDLSQAAKMELAVRLSPKHINITRWTKEIVESFANLLPWLLILPCCWMKKYVNSIPEEQKGYFLAFRNSLVIAFIAHNAFPGTMSRYSMPVVPMSAILVGWTMYYRPELDKSDKPWQVTALIATIFIPIASCLLAIRYGITTKTVAAAILAFIAMCLLLVLRKSVNSKFSLALLTSLIIAVFSFIYSTASALSYGNGSERRTTAELINNSVQEGKKLWICEPGYQSFIFYINCNYDYIQADKISELKPEYLLVKEKYLRELTEAGLFNIFEKYRTRAAFFYSTEEQQFFILERRKL